MTRGVRGEYRKGRVFGLWTVLSVQIEEDPPHRTMVRCRCECGRIALVRGSNLGKDSSSCGRCTMQARGLALGKANVGRKRKVNGTGEHL
jgi:hypothetical protein